jgi:site-specific DNA recombinase
VALLELARNAQRLFKKQEPRERRRLLDFVVSNCTWRDGALNATLRQPFDLLAETTAIAAQTKFSDGRNSTKSEIWLRRQDSNL